ncbi:MAG: class I SAM-dependent methyltransferase [bacterium]
MTTAYYEHAAGPDPVARIAEIRSKPQEMARLRGVVDAIPAEARRVLDVGCGPGIALDLLRAQRPEVVGVGVDLSRRAVEAGRAALGLELVQGRADALPFADRSFDAVLATELLEHLPHGVYEAARGEIERVAGSAVVVTVPFREARERVSCPACGCRFHPFYHLRSFDRAALEGLLPGFECASIALTWTRGHFPGLRTARRIKAALGWPAPLPRHTVCPQCGFHRAPTTGPGGSADAAGAGLRRVVYGVMGAVPRPRRARWARALYRRR